MAVTTRVRPFDVQAFLDSSGVAKEVVAFRANAVIYTQGDPADAVMYVQNGRVKLSVISHGGNEAVVGVLGRGDFVGEGCLAGQAVRMGSVTAMTATTVLVVEKQKMVRLLQEEPTLSKVFIAYILARNIRIEDDLVDQLFNSTEKRLARILLLLAQYGKQEASHRIIPKVSQEVLAEMIGTTRSRVNLFMNKFRKLGFIDYNGVFKISNALMSVVLHA
jgi:CRP/FNR family transcriptional regulator, cyclic AMP receptor protein